MVEVKDVFMTFWPYKWKIKCEIICNSMLSRFLLLKSKALRFISLPKNGWFAALVHDEEVLVNDCHISIRFQLTPPKLPQISIIKSNSCQLSFQSFQIQQSS